MLQRPDWDESIEDKVIYSEKAIVAWASKQPKDRLFNFCDPERCLAAEYLKEHGKPYNIDTPTIAKKFGSRVLTALLKPQGLYGTYGDFVRDMK